MCPSKHLVLTILCFIWKNTNNQNDFLLLTEVKVGFRFKCRLRVTSLEGPHKH